MSLASRMNNGCHGIGRVGVMWTPRTTTTPPGATSSAQRASESSRARGLDDDVVGATRADAGAEALGRFLLMTVAGLDGDLGGALMAGAGGGEETEPTGADDGDRGGGVGPAEAGGVPGDRRWFDDGRVTGFEARRDLDQPIGGRSVLLGHPAVDGDAQGPLGVGGTEVVPPLAAWLAVAAAEHRLDDHRRAVSANARDLMAEDPLQAVADVEEVRAADAGGSNVDELAGAGWLVERPR